MKRILFSVGLAVLSAMPAVATIVVSCDDALQAVVDRQEDLWVGRCAGEQSKNMTAAAAERICRQWLETCRRNSSMRPGFMTF